MSIVDKDLTTIAICWRIERRDGLALGFTSHDRDLDIGGLRYRAAPGMLPSAIALSDGFEADGLDVEGALTLDAISGDDLSAGRWDGAAVTVFMVDWEDSGAPAIALARGELGDVRVRRNGFEAELRSSVAALERPVAERTSPECRAELGDKRCRVDMAGRTRLVRIVAVSSPTVIDVATETTPGAYRYGRARWLSGRNCGLEVEVAGCEASRLTLRDSPHYPAEAGDLIEIAEGCDKRFTTCVGRFGNGLNFRGEPHLPGMDLLTRYPGA